MACTLHNEELAPRLTYRMRVPVITDCTQPAVEPEMGDLLCTKPVFGFKVVYVFRPQEALLVGTARTTGSFRRV